VPERGEQGLKVISRLAEVLQISTTLVYSRLNRFFHESTITSLVPDFARPGLRHEPGSRV